MIKAVFFDTSDTLYKSEEFEKAQSNQPIKQLANIKNISVEEAKVLFSAKQSELEATLDHVTKVAVMMELGISRLQMQEYMALVDAIDYLLPDEQLRAMLEKLSKTYKLGIISNILEKAVKNVLEGLEIPKNYFEYFVTVSNTSNSKPDPEPFLKAQLLSGFQPEEIAYIGDSLTKDIIPAKKCGLKTILISSGSLQDPNVDFTVKSIYEVPRAINILSKL